MCWGYRRTVRVVAASCSSCGLARPDSKEPTGRKLVLAPYPVSARADWYTAHRVAPRRSRRTAAIGDFCIRHALASLSPNRPLRRRRASCCAAHEWRQRAARPHCCKTLVWPLRRARGEARPAAKVPSLPFCSAPARGWAATSICVSRRSGRASPTDLLQRCRAVFHQA